MKRVSKGHAALGSPSSATRLLHVLNRGNHRETLFHGPSPGREMRNGRPKSMDRWRRPRCRPCGKASYGERLMAIRPGSTGWWPSRGWKPRFDFVAGQENPCLQHEKCTCPLFPPWPAKKILVYNMKNVPVPFFLSPFFLSPLFLFTDLLELRTSNGYGKPTTI
jgi:hypothetical protein